MKNSILKRFSWILGFLLASTDSEVFAEEKRSNKSVVIPLSLYLDAIPSIRVKVGDQDELFLFDTAGGITVITPQTAEAIGHRPWGQITGYRMRGDRVDIGEHIGIDTAALFDGPSAALESCTVRNVSTVPLQALYLLNNDFCLHRAQAFAKRVTKQAGPDLAKQITTAFQLALGRAPDAHERMLSQQFLASHPGNAGAALAQFCQALLNVNEFVYLE